MPAAPAAQGGGQGGDHSYDILWGMAAVAVIAAIVWYLYRAQIAVGFLTLKIYELDAMNYLGKLVNHPYYFEPLRQSLILAREGAANADYMDLLNKGGKVGMYLRIPFVVLLVLMGIVVYITNTSRVYRRTYGMMDFAKLESRNWPQIMPVMNMDLIKTDIDTGPWAMALTPMLFCKNINCSRK